MSWNEFHTEPLPDIHPELVQSLVLDVLGNDRQRVSQSGHNRAKQVPVAHVAREDDSALVPRERLAGKAFPFDVDIRAEEFVRHFAQPEDFYKIHPEVGVHPPDDAAYFRRRLVRETSGQRTRWHPSVITDDRAINPSETAANGQRRAQRKAREESGYRLQNQLHNPEIQLGRSMAGESIGYRPPQRKVTDCDLLRGSSWGSPRGAQR